ncbi:MAG TPA: ATP-binding cassette domain-containing protein, partial [Candidatus Limnocylindrales bacterium]|nr:ATP-binding cassette domain-containing protein [Candidatus Limnocylindrales bacterium]
MISVESLVKRYKKADRNAVDGISFEVRGGEFFALLGPNGAGKTTTISILTTTLTPTSGRATIDGRDITREASAVRRSVGIIFQRPSIDMNLTAEENVRFHAILYGLYPYAPSFALMSREYREQVRGLADLLGITEDMHKP